MAPRLKSYTFSAPTHWASYLVNGDSSGMDDVDIAACDEWLEHVGMGAPVDVEEIGFMKYCDARLSGCIAYACYAAEYTFLREE